MKRIVLIIGLLCFTFFSAKAEFVIKGNVNLSSEWHPEIFLAAISTLDDYYKAKADLIVGSALINENGGFEIRGSQLPADRRFYRLYLIKEENTEFDACLYVGGDDHNFVHIILDNETELEVKTTNGGSSPFGNYTLIGDKENQSLRTLNELIHPSFYFYQIKFPSELRFSEQRLFDDLKVFVDTCSSPLVAMAAMINTDIDQNYETNTQFYESFSDRINLNLSSSIYTNQYKRKLKFLSKSDEKQLRIFKWLTLILGLLSLGLCYQFLKIRRELNTLSHKQEVNPIALLTKQEFQIFKLIKEGKSNKEIASELFIGLSTVKSHINKIYSKLKISKRSELINQG